MVNDTEDYTEAVIIKGSDGTSLVTLLTDSSGRLIGILQGEYGGELKTIKLDSTGRMLGRFMPSVETVINDRAEATIGAGGYKITQSAAVAAGKRWKITHILMKNETGYTRGTHAYIAAVSGFMQINSILDVPKNCRLVWDGEIWLGAGDKLYLYWTGATEGDAVKAYWNGAEYAAEY